MRRFEELAWSETPRGEISLRRRIEPTLKVDVYEVKLGDEFLMSSLFTVAEIELARLGLARAKGEQLDVVVGGLGLGCTAKAALEDPRVSSVLVVDAMPEVIDWHERELLPDAPAVVRDERTRLLLGNFFELAASEHGFDPDSYVTIADVVARLGEGWQIEQFESERHVTEGAGAHHQADIVLIARRSD